MPCHLDFVLGPPFCLCIVEKGEKGEGILWQLLEPPGTVRGGDRNMGTVKISLRSPGLDAQEGSSSATYPRPELTQLTKFQIVINRDQDASAPSALNGPSRRGEAVGVGGQGHRIGISLSRFRPWL